MYNQEYGKDYGYNKDNIYMDSYYNFYMGHIEYFHTYYNSISYHSIYKGNIHIDCNIGNPRNDNLGSIGKDKFCNFDNKCI